jgi:hypothetical protein
MEEIPDRALFKLVKVIHIKINMVQVEEKNGDYESDGFAQEALHLHKLSNLIGKFMFFILIFGISGLPNK